MQAFYVVKNPGQDQLDACISFDDARLAESNFFISTAPWSAADSELLARLGVNNTRGALSELLVARLLEALPAMREAAGTEADRVTKQLKKLPPAPQKDPLGEFDTIVSEIITELHDQIEVRFRWRHDGAAWLDGRQQPDRMHMPTLNMR